MIFTLFFKNFISTDTFLSDMYKTCDERVFLYVQEYTIYRERSWPLTSCWNIAVVKLWIICQVSNNLYGVIVISRETNRPLYIYIQTNIKWEQTSTYK